jgi:alginate O-acetyltransferase complex protein AlgI
MTDLETLLKLRSNFVFLIVAILACTPLARNLYRRLSDSIDHMPLFQRSWTVLQSLYPVLLLVLSTAALVGDQYNPFLYYRF